MTPLFRPSLRAATRPAALLAAVIGAVAAAPIAAVPLGAQDFRVAGGVTLPRAGGSGADIGGQVQASMELAPGTNGVGVRLDVLYSQSATSAMSVGDVLFNGRTMRTMAAAGGLFYRHEVRDFAPYLLAGGGAYGQTGTSGVALGLHGGVGVDYAGSRTRPFAEARIHRWRGDQAAVTVQQRERSLVSVLVGFRF